MATAAQAYSLRLLIGPGVITDDEITQIIDSTVPEGETDPDMLAAKALVWEAMAARYHGLVDTSESGSSRSMSQMFKNASTMAAATRAEMVARDEVTVTVTKGRTQTRRITRV